MPRHQLHTRSKKHIILKLPGGRTRLHYKGRAPSQTLCASCGQPIAGIPPLTTSHKRKLNRSRSRVWRPYGGRVCHSCLKNSLKQAARNL